MAGQKRQNYRLLDDNREGQHETSSIRTGRSASLALQTALPASREAENFVHSKGFRPDTRTSQTGITPRIGLRMTPCLKITEPHAARFGGIGRCFQTDFQNGQRRKWQHFFRLSLGGVERGVGVLRIDCGETGVLAMPSLTSRQKFARCKHQFCRKAGRATWCGSGKCDGFMLYISAWINLGLN